VEKEGVGGVLSFAGPMFFATGLREIVELGWVRGRRGIKRKR
jgi:hypothetical protein